MSAAGTGIPFMLTAAMKITLRARGYTDSDISQMTPARAHEIISGPWSHLPASGPPCTEWAIETLFGPHKDEAWVTMVQDVKDPSDWVGGRYLIFKNKLRNSADAAHYVNQTLIREFGARTNEDSEGGMFVVFDDVGEVGVNPNAKMSKDWLDLLGPTPTMVVETSADNYQYFFAFHQLVPPVLFGALTKAFKAHPDMKGGFEDHSGLVRYVRLPSGRNVKPGRNGFLTRLIEGSGKKYDPLELANMFGLKMLTVVPPPPPTGTADECSMEEIRALLLGEHAPLKNDSRFDDRALYVELIHFVKGASGGSPEGLDVINEWGASLERVQDPTNDPELRWDSIHSPRGGADALRLMAKKMDPYGAARVTFSLATPLPDPRANLLLSAWLERDLPPRDHLLGRLLCTTSRWLVFGETGVGKSLLCLDIAAATSAGCALLGWAGSGKPRRVMYLDGEMPKETFKERMQLIASRYGPDLQLYGYNRDDLDDDEMPPLNTPEGEAWLMKEIETVNPDIIFLDSIMCLLSGVMSEEESWAPVKRLVRKLTAKRIAQVWLHHTGHDTSKGFGTKTREWEMDTVMKLVFADETKTAFTMSFEKARLRNPTNWPEFDTRTISLTPDGWTSEPARGKPQTGKGAEEAKQLRTAVLDAYNRLSAAVEPTPDADGKPVRKVETDKLRNEVKTRGWLDTKETGGLTGGGRMAFLRTKTALLASGRYFENEGLFWEGGIFPAVDDVF